MINETIQESREEMNRNREDRLIALYMKRPKISAGIIAAVSTPLFLKTGVEHIIDPSRSLIRPEVSEAINSFAANYFGYDNPNAVGYVIVGIGIASSLFAYKMISDVFHDTIKFGRL